MRFLFALVGLVAVVVIILWALGMLSFNARPGALPHLEGGSAPSVTANVATISVGTANKSVDVPTVTTTEKSISVPTIKLNKPEQPSNAAAPQ